MNFLIIIMIQAIGFSFLKVASMFFPEWINYIILGDKRLTLLSMQTFMWIIFFLGIGELLKKFKIINSMKSQTKDSILKEDEEILYTAKELIPLYQKNSKLLETKPSFVSEVIKEVILQFRANKSFANTQGILNSMFTDLEEKILNSYSKIKYIVWVIPTLGFIGTVYGISSTVNVVSKFDLKDPKLMSVMTRELAFAFDTTLLALIHSIILMYFLTHFESQQLNYLNKGKDYIMRFLLNRLVEPRD